MKLKLLFIASLFAMQTTAIARIGETYDELVQRYGKPKSTIPAKDGLPQGYIFHFDHFSIGVGLLDGRSAVETFTQLGPPVFVKQPDGRDERFDPISATISETSKDMVLGANSRGKRWERIVSLNWLDEQWDLGTNHPITKSKLINAWKLVGEQIFCSEERKSDGFCELMVFSQEWSHFFAPIARKIRQQEVKESGL